MPVEVKPPAPWYQVRYANLEREAACNEGETLFHSARRAGVRIVGACGGRGVCGSCVVRIASGEVEGRGKESVSGRTKEWVRACLVSPTSDCVVEVAPRSIAAVVRAEIGGDEIAITPEPAVQAHDVVLPPAQMGQGGADADRVVDALRAAGAARVDLPVLRELPRLLRETGWRLQAMVRGDEVIGVAPAGARRLGLAVDLGTTNCAGFLIDLANGERLASLGLENPQAGYGADLVSRVNHAIQSADGAHELRAAAIAGIAGLAQDLCAAVSVATTDIYEITVCGNTAMHHLLLGLPVAQLGRAPFVPALCEAVDVKARDLGLPAAPGAWLHLMPNVGGYVGGDHVAALLATEHRWAGTTIVMDVGTNTEISLIHAGKITSVSCPSGPALEGGHISAGMRAAEGAIERVRIGADGSIELGVIGKDAEPVGLCGSGVLDALAALARAGIVDARGRIQLGHPAVRTEDAVRGHATQDAKGPRSPRREVVLAPDVRITQDDVRAIQLAKAAIRAGIDCLLQEAGIDENALERVVIAGAFGAYIDVASAVAIGLLPALPPERYEQVGNSAGVGVRMALASVRARARASELAGRCRYLELGTLPHFQRTFMRRIGFE